MDSRTTQVVDLRDTVSRDPPAPLAPPNDPSSLSSPLSPSLSPTTRRRRPDPTPLTRAGSVGSSYSAAGASLRRMATHETGEYASSDDEGCGLSTHEEHDDEHRPWRHSMEEYTSRSPRRARNRSLVSLDETRSPYDEERAIGSIGSGVSPQNTPDDRVQDESTANDGGSIDEPPTEDRKKGKKKEFELQDQTNLLPVRQVILIFLGLNCALFCSLLDQTIVTTALPTLGKVFNEASIASWVGTAYMLTSTALQPVYGRLSDIWGRKVVLLGSLFIFLVGSIACSVSQSMIQLIVFRAIQGCGGGGILTLAMIIISDVVSLKDRGKYQGITGGVVATANSLGPVLGGIFTEKLTWRWCFYINLPLTALAILSIFFLLPLKKVHGSWRSKLKKLDFYGAALTLAWAVLVLLALSWSGSKYPWSSPAVIAPLVIGIVLLGVFVFVEAKLVPLPLVPLYIFKDMTVAASMATTFANGAAFFCSLYYLPQYFQVVRGEDPLQSGVDMLPLIFVQVFVSFCSGFTVSKTGDYKWNLMLGFFIWTIGMGLMGTLTPTTPKAHIYGFQVLVGVGAGQTFQTSLIAIQASVARKDMATATGCRNFLRMLGGTVSLAACAAIINNLVSTRLDQLALGSGMETRILQSPTELAALDLSAEQIESIRSAYAKAIDACFFFCVPLTGISFFVTVFFVKRVPLKRGDEAQLKAEAKKWMAEKKDHGKDDKEGTTTPAGEGKAEKSSNDKEEKSSDKVSPQSSERTLGDDQHGSDLGEKAKEAVERLPDEMESAARGMEEASGVKVR